MEVFPKKYRTPLITPSPFSKMLRNIVRATPCHHLPYTVAISQEEPEAMHNSPTALACCGTEDIKWGF